MNHEQWQQKRARHFKDGDAAQSQQGLSPTPSVAAADGLREGPAGRPCPLNPPLVDPWQRRRFRMDSGFWEMRRFKIELPRCPLI